jgi:hypothetical protein
MPMQDQLKKAIIQMLPKEKDKLLLRLIAKNSTLTDKLYFELIEESLTIPERREAISSHILSLSQMRQDSPAWILTEMRNLSGDIAYHVKVTKDKLGALELNLFLMNTFLEAYRDRLSGYTSRTDKIALYIAKKALTIVNGLNKLDDDYRFDFRKDANNMLGLVHSLCSKMYVRQLDIPSELE